MQRMQTSIDHLAAIGRHLLPPRQNFSLKVLALLGREPFEHLLAFADRAALGGRKAIPLLQVLANLLLALSWQTLKALIVLHEALLLLRRHVSDLLHPFRRQRCHGSQVGLPLRTNYVSIGARLVARLRSLA